MGYYIPTAYFLEDIEKALMLKSNDELMLWANIWHDVINRLLGYHNAVITGLPKKDPIFHYEQLNDILFTVWFGWVKELAVELEQYKKIKPWHFYRQSALMLAPADKSTSPFRAPTPQDIQFVINFYNNNPIPHYEIDPDSIKVIYNPSSVHSFSERLNLLQKRHNDLNFFPNDKSLTDDIVKKNLGRLDTPQQKSCREDVRQEWLQLKAANQKYTDSVYPEVTILTLWNGFKMEKHVKSIADKNYGHVEQKTDMGYFGKGFYFTSNIAYAKEYGEFFMINRVAVYNAFPVIYGDGGFDSMGMPNKLYGKGTPSGFDATFTPVVHISGPVYNSPPLGKPATFYEIAAFEAAPCLPQFAVKLKSS